jgi:hypothetical protein
MKRFSQKKIFGIEGSEFTVYKTDNQTQMVFTIASVRSIVNFNKHMVQFEFLLRRSNNDTHYKHPLGIRVQEPTPKKNRILFK